MFNEELILRDIPLKAKTTIKIGGPAAFFFSARSTQDILGSIQWAKHEHIPYHVIGRGTNLLAADSGFPGLIIQTHNDDAVFSGEHLMVGAGGLFAHVSQRGMEHGLAGLECGIGIPGTIGGAIVGNASNFLGSVSDRLTTVNVFNGKECRTLQKDDCKFSYRHSIFKEHPWIILEAQFLLRQDSQRAIKERMDHILEYKKKTQKSEFPTSGCMFKNPIIQNEKHCEKMKSKGLARFIRWSDDMAARTIPVRALIEAAGFRNQKTGGIAVSDANANFFLNVNNGTASDVLALMKKIREAIFEKFEILLSEEIQKIGF